MKKIILTAAAATLALGTAAFAGGHSNSQAETKGNKTNARSMSTALAGGGGGNASALKDVIGATGEQGGVASFVSGDGTGGWGNVGSTLTGGQVSKRNK